MFDVYIPTTGDDIVVRSFFLENEDDFKARLFYLRIHIVYCLIFNVFVNNWLVNCCFIITKDTNPRAGHLGSLIYLFI